MGHIGTTRWLQIAVRVVRLVLLQQIPLLKTLRILQMQETHLE